MSRVMSQAEWLAWCVGGPAAAVAVEEARDEERRRQAQDGKRILVCGARELGLAGPRGHAAARIDAELGALTAGVSVEKVVVIHGACSRRRPGIGEVSADMLAEAVAQIRGYRREPYPVDEKLDGAWPHAGPRRNRRMLQASRPHQGLALGEVWRQVQNTRREEWRTTGTGGMVSLMLAAGLPVRWVRRLDGPALDLVGMPSSGPEVR